MTAAPFRRRPPDPGRRRRSVPDRRGVSLLELALVVVLIGIFTAVAANRSDGAFEDVQVRTQARTVAGLLRTARRRAILTGRDSGLRYVRTGTRISAVVPVERVGAALVDTDDPVAVPDDIKAFTSATDATFDFEGLGPAAGHAVNFVGPNRNWDIYIPPSSSAVRVFESP